MTDSDHMNEKQANILCKSCGLCCTGHLFIWVRLKASELERAQALGLNVIRSDPRQRGFTQPCPLWQRQCTIYISPDYPRVCHNYKCKLLKELLHENTALPEALVVIQQAKGIIHELEALLPASPSNNFRERLVAYIEGATGQEITNPELWQKANALLVYYEEIFGIKDLIEKSDEG